MRRRQTRIRMGLRGRSGCLTYLLLGTAVLIAVYYVWNNYFTSPSRIIYSSVQDLKPDHMVQWNKQGPQRGFAMEEPPVELNKEIEMQMADEKWKKAKALQDRIDEERLLEENAAEQHFKNVDYFQKGKQSQQQKENVGPKPLLYQQVNEAHREYFSKLERLVHLDLKGAPPLVSYLERLFPVLKKMGATGLLIEYEDMFPYSGNISILAAGNAYSQSDLQRIQAAAISNGLEIIPLVQTFGHMEFVLKYKSFQDLRENVYTPQVITPVKRESYTLLFKMIKQIVKAHPNSRRIHLGCDEVFELGKGQSSDQLARQGITPSHLFLRHVFKLASHIRKTFPQVQPLIWDDWLRNIPYGVLADSGLPAVVEPVVWYYRNNILDRVPADTWKIYGRLFPAVWVASAFKGATGSDQLITNVSFHLDNNLHWVNVIHTFGIQQKVVNFRGMVFTGWQRYDHFGALCELLPVALPSLALSMQAVYSGGFGSEQMLMASRLLSCSNKLDLEFPELDNEGAKVTQDCHFPGSSVYYSVQQLWGIMEAYQRNSNLQSHISGWLSDYHIQQGISNPGRMRILARYLAKVQDQLQGLIVPMRNSLLQIYDQSTIDEWMATNLQGHVAHMKDLLNKTKKLLERKDWPARPFPEPASAANQKGVKTAESKFDRFQQNSNLGHRSGGMGQNVIQNSNLQQSGNVQQNAAFNLLPQGPQPGNSKSPVKLQEVNNVIQSLAKFPHQPGIPGPMNAQGVNNKVDALHNLGQRVEQGGVLHDAGGAGQQDKEKRKFLRSPVNAQGLINKMDVLKHLGQQNGMPQPAGRAGQEGVGSDKFLKPLASVHGVINKSKVLQNQGPNAEVGGMPQNAGGTGQGQGGGNINMLGGQKGSVLSQTLLQNPGSNQGLPSGPDKIQFKVPQIQNDVNSEQAGKLPLYPQRMQQGFRQNPQRPNPQGSQLNLLDLKENPQGLNNLHLDLQRTAAKSSKKNDVQKQQFQMPDFVGAQNAQKQNNENRQERQPALNSVNVKEESEKGKQELQVPEKDLLFNGLAQPMGDTGNRQNKDSGSHRRNDGHFQSEGRMKDLPEIGGDRKESAKHLDSFIGQRQQNGNREK